jgi:hypothetical protein
MCICVGTIPHACTTSPFFRIALGEPHGDRPRLAPVDHDRLVLHLPLRGMARSPVVRVARDA